MPEAERPAPAPQTLLAFDFGLKRTGVAAGNTLTRDAAGRFDFAIEGT